MTLITSSAASETDSARNFTPGRSGATPAITASPPPSGEVHVQQHHVRVELADQRHRLRDAAGLAHDLDARRRARRGRPHGRARGRRRARRAASRRPPSASSARPRFPAPGADDDRRRPPARIIRPSIDSAMPVPVGATASRSKPTPRSRTKTPTPPPSASAYTEISSAPGELRGVRHRLARGEHELARPARRAAQSPALASSIRTPCRSSTSAAASASAPTSDVAGCDPLRTATAQLALLPPRQRGDPLRVGGVALDRARASEAPSRASAPPPRPAPRPDPLAPLGSPPATPTGRRRGAGPRPARPARQRTATSRGRRAVPLHRPSSARRLAS